MTAPKPCGCQYQSEECPFCEPLRAHRLTPAPATSASEVAKGAGVTPCVCGGLRTQRERYTFTGRETHWGYTYLVWTRDDGKRYARVMH